MSCCSRVWGGLSLSTGLGPQRAKLSLEGYRQIRSLVM